MTLQPVPTVNHIVKKAIRPQTDKPINHNTHNKLSRWVKLAILTTFTVGTLGLTACQSTPTSPVMQRANSTFETTGLGPTKAKAQQNALDSANKTCGRRQPIILNDKVIYNGVLDERTGRMVEQVGSIAGAVLGKGMPNMSRDDDYEYNITFRCQ